MANPVDVKAPLLGSGEKSEDYEVYRKMMAAATGLLPMPIVIQAELPSAAVRGVRKASIDGAESIIPAISLLILFAFFNCLFFGLCKREGMTRFASFVKLVHIAVFAYAAGNFLWAMVLLEAWYFFVAVGGSAVLIGACVYFQL